MQHKIIVLNISKLTKVTEKPRKKSEKKWGFGVQRIGKVSTFAAI